MRKSKKSLPSPGTNARDSETEESDDVEVDETNVNFNGEEVVVEDDQEGGGEEEDTAKTTTAVFPSLLAEALSQVWQEKDCWGRLANVAVPPEEKAEVPEGHGDSVHPWTAEAQTVLG